MVDAAAIVTFFTPDYEADAAKLVASGLAHGAQVHAVPLPDRGTWARNLVSRAQAMRRARQETRGPLLFIDADCEIQASLPAIDELLRGADVLVRRRVPPGEGDSVNLGVLGLADNPDVQRLLDCWAAYVTLIGERYSTVDQRPFAMAMATVGQKLIVCDLPGTLNTMPSDGERLGPALIKHRKRSRDDVRHRQWVKERLLEALLTRRLADWRPLRDVAFWRLAAQPSSAPVLKTGFEASILAPLATINWVPDGLVHPQLVHSVWTDRQEVMRAGVAAGLTVVVPTILDTGPLGQVLRTAPPAGSIKPSAQNPPYGRLYAYYVRPGGERTALDGDLPADPLLAAIEYLGQGAPLVIQAP